MKIAVWHNLPSGGAKRALYDQVRELKNRGHELEAWCPPTADDSYLPLSDLIPEHVLALPDASELDHSFSSRLRTGFYQPGPAFRSMLAHCREVAEAVRRGGFDLFFGNTCVQYRTAPIARFIDLPSVLYLQEPFRWFYEALPELPWLAPRIGGSIWRPSLRQKTAVLRELMHNRRIRIQAREELESAKAYDRVLVNSLYSRESVLRAYGIDARSCYLGIDPGLFRHTAKKRRNIVLGVGSFDRIKNIHFVIEAVAQLGDLRPELIWVGNSGEEAYRQELVELAAKEGVDYSPRLMVSDEELVELMNSARVMAYAPRLEPFGLTPLESNACGLPVVGVAEGGVRETVSHGDNGILVDPEPEAMARGLRRFLEDPEYAERLGRQAMDHVNKHWSLSAASDRLERHFKALIDYEH